LLDVWKRGIKEGVIKPMSDYMLYAYAINPLSFLTIAQNRGALVLDDKQLELAFEAAWSSIKVCE
ncbi:MAG: TetR/AcrR family transcriptional regulator, partial [Maribacter dokdonensis]